MSAMIPMALYGLEVPAGDVAIPAKSDIPSAFRITMAAIDPSAIPEIDEEGTVPRATLKVIRQALIDFDSEDEDEDEEDFDISEMERMLAEGGDSESDSDDEEVNGGPSDPARSKKAQKAAAQAEIMKLLAEADDEEMDVDEQPNGKKSLKALGKMPASDSDEDDEDISDSEDGEEYEEFVICTLDPAKNYQQTLDITVGENERVFFKVSGTHSVYLTGNYVEPAGHDHKGMYDPDSDEEDDDMYDLEPDSDEIDDMDEEDELDDIEDPRITEVEEDEAPQLVKADSKKDKKGKNKRAAEDEAEVGASLDELVAKAAGTNGEAKLSKKQLKKQKKNDGTAVEAEAPSSNKSDKKVSFAKELEQGPTPTKDAKAAASEKKSTPSVRTVQGVTIDDKKVGTGPAAKAGDRVGMRYIGKLEKDGKIFDSNKKGKPFTFKLGSGEVIKGWDIGIAGMSAGGERRVTIPAHLGYGKQGSGPIPGNATLVFDVKLLEINKKK
ncbi:unnamed protein product [Zymoseptoria tritici ST99CH_1E4]|uniref:peptidylprolyl isomerase n=1 Tax=Zymoseptoria tritici ST99CH_1E4 TaxID=1276532 RepID=A0A2H1GJI2_ZYMTR|nr:unnamed protein product [Zymoseptoria tritici ST99CH_1E4]